ncbi:MAG: hypothetical protein RLZZ128_602, partial [Actinomycetota bacterium]
VDGSTHGTSLVLGLDEEKVDDGGLDTS